MDNKEKVFEKFYPLFKIEWEQTCYLRDVDSAIWLDASDEDLARTGTRSVIYIKENPNEEWKNIYNGFSLGDAERKLDKLKEKYDYWKTCFIKNECVMFEYQNQMFKAPDYVKNGNVCLNGTSIIGKPIEPEHYYTGEDESIRIDLMNDGCYVFPYEKDCMAVVLGKVWFNGEVLLTEKQIKELGFDLYDFEAFHKKEVKEWIKKNIPEAKTYNSNWASGYLNNIKKQVNGYYSSDK